jgi:hypothetical protein
MILSDILELVALTHVCRLIEVDSSDLIVTECHAHQYKPAVSYDVAASPRKTL